MRKFNPFSLCALSILAFTVGCAQPLPSASVGANAALPIDDPMLLPQKLSPDQVLQVPYDKIVGLQAESKGYQIMRGGRGGGFGGRGGGFGGRGFGGRGFGGRGFGRWGGSGWGANWWGGGLGWGNYGWGGLNSLALYPYGGYYYPYYLNAGVYSPFWSTPYTYGAGVYSPYYAAAYPNAYSYVPPVTAVPPYAPNYANYAAISQQVPPANAQATITINR